MANHPKAPAKNPTGDFGQFKDFMRRLVAVPHAEIKAKLDGGWATQRGSITRVCLLTLTEITGGCRVPGAPGSRPFFGR